MIRLSSVSLKKDIFLWLYWNPVRAFVQCMPPTLSYKVASLAGAAAYKGARGKKLAFEDEYKSIFRHKVDDKIMADAVKRTFINLCRFEAEMMQYPKMNKRNIRSFVECPSFENLNKGLEAGKGVMLVFAHFGANQMVMPAVGYNGYRMSQMSAPATVWEEKLRNRRFSLMEKKGLELRWLQELSLPVRHINIFGSMKEVFQCLRKNEVLGIAMDGGGGNTRVVVDFLGRKAQFSTGAFEIAVRTGCTVLPTFMIRERDGRNRMIIEPPLEIKMDEGDVAGRYVSAFACRLEEYVYKYPCHYLNFLALRTFMERQGDISLFVKEKNNENTVSQAAVS